MAKKYTRKQVSSIAELDKEQRRIRHKTRQIEDDVLHLFSPQQLALTFAGKLLSGKVSHKASQLFSAGTKHKNTGKNKAPTAKGAISNFVSKPATKSLAKKIGISFLKWQTFNLALFVGKKIIQKIKENRRRKKFSSAAY